MFLQYLVTHYFVRSSDRYEREETFMALNLGVTSCQSLEISLDQFVRGEVLEGSNAYYCEKCKEKVRIQPLPARPSLPDAVRTLTTCSCPPHPREPQ